MEVSQHLDALAVAGHRLADAAAAAGPDAAVPTCPGWVVRDLVRHQGGVHRWAAGIVSGPRTEPWDVDLDDVVGSWPADDELLAWFVDGLTALGAALAAADPNLVCWTFLSAPSPRQMWARRQAHETSVHCADAELAAGRAIAPFPAGLAADGIDELLACFITRPGGSLRADPVRRLGIVCTDAPGEWLVSIEPDRVITTAGQGVAGADCVAAGPAQELYLVLWNRLPATGLTISGDTGALELFNDQVRVRWS